VPSHASVVEHQAPTSPCHQAKTFPWKILPSSEMGDPTLLQYPAHSHQLVPPKSSTPAQNHTEKKLPTKHVIVKLCTLHQVYQDQLALDQVL